MEYIKILVRKNLKMSTGKLAAQAVHAALALPGESSRGIGVVVLQVSDKKFAEAKKMHNVAVIRDAGLTEVEPGTETALAYFERPDVEQH